MHFIFYEEFEGLEKRGLGVDEEKQPSIEAKSSPPILDADLTNHEICELWYKCLKKMQIITDWQ